MSEKELEGKRNQYLNTIDDCRDRLRANSERFHKEQKRLRNDLANVIEEAKLESDLSLAEISRHTGITRQAIHKIIKERFGVRHPDKAEAALIGHKNREEQVVNS